jgi:ADP-ribose diphosphatase
VIKGLSEHQQEALRRYFSLLESHPELFTDRTHRPIVREPEILETFAANHHIVLGVPAATPYLWLINDLVQSHDTSGAVLLHPYLRIVAPPEAIGTSDVVVLATIQAESVELIVLVEQERHATGTLELALPRGFGESTSTPALQALRELQEETGYVGERAELLGSTLTDSGTTDRTVSFFHTPVIDNAAQSPEPQEAIARIVIVTRDELWTHIDAGTVRDGYTVQALALYERHLATRRESRLSTVKPAPDA